MGYGLAAPALVAAAPAVAEEEAPVVDAGAPAPALAYAGLPFAGYTYAGLPHAALPYAGLPYTATTLPKLEVPAGAISYSLGGVPFIVPAVAAEAAEVAVAEEAVVEVAEE